jgi:hypothetical protein
VGAFFQSEVGLRILASLSFFLTLALRRMEVVNEKLNIIIERIVPQVMLKREHLNFATSTSKNLTLILAS